MNKVTQITNKGFYQLEANIRKGLTHKQVAIFVVSPTQQSTKLKRESVNGFTNHFQLQESARAGYFIVADTFSQIVCSFETGKFFDTQKLIFLNKNQFQNLATILRELSDWLCENHSDKV